MTGRRRARWDLLPAGEVAAAYKMPPYNAALRTDGIRQLQKIGGETPLGWLKLNGESKLNNLPSDRGWS